MIKSRFNKILGMIILVVCTMGAKMTGSIAEGGTSIGSTNAVTQFIYTSGLLTTSANLDEYALLIDTGNAYETDRNSLISSSHAGGAKDNWSTFVHSGAVNGLQINAEAYNVEADLGGSNICKPTSVSPDAADIERYDLTEIASKIYAMAVAGSIQNDNSYRAAVETRLLELTTITSFPATQSGANQCALDLATAGVPIVSAALLLEDDGYTDWDYNDRLQLAQWLADEVFTITDYAARDRKGNWGFAGLGGAYAIAVFADGPIASLTKSDTTTTTPAAYWSTEIPTLLATQLSTSPGDELDSECAVALEVFGIQPGGTSPDDMRRVSGGTSNTANCGEVDLEFADACQGGAPYTLTSQCGGSANAVFYQQKSTQLLARQCEMMRRVEGDGVDCYDLNHDAAGDETLFEMIEASTTLVPPTVGQFEDVWTQDTTQGYRWLAGQYYGINKAGTESCITDLLDDTTVFIEGGNDVPYARITHADGVAWPTVPTDCGAPAAPTGLAATPGSTTIAVTWDIPSEGDYDHSDLEHDLDPADWVGSTLLSPFARGASITGLASEATYDIRVRHCDTNANCSAWVVLENTTTTADTGFVEISSSPVVSALATRTAVPDTSRLPYTYLDTNDGPNDTPLVNYSTWDGYDVTCECVDASCVADDPGNGCTPASGMIAFPASGGGFDDPDCAPVQTDPTDTNVAPELQCLLAAIPAQSYLYIPDGTYRLASSAGGAVPAALDLDNPAKNQRGMLGQSKANTILIVGDGTEYDAANNGNTVSLGLTLSTNENGSISTVGTWTGGFERGETDLNVGDTSIFPIGTWVYLRADATGIQPGAQGASVSDVPRYYAKVSSIVSAGAPGVIRIDRPLPDFFDPGGSSQEIFVWVPQATEFFLENFTVSEANPTHASHEVNLVRVTNCAYCHIKGVKITDTYSTSLILQFNVRSRFEDIDIDSEWDKPFNAYAIWVEGGADNLFLNNMAYNYPQGYLCSGYGQQHVFAFNTMINPEPNRGPPTGDTDEWYDPTANNTYDEGHSTHGVTIAATSAVMHCTQNNASEASPDHGATSGCRGTRADEARFSFFIHNAPCSNTLIIRDRWESGMGTDDGDLQGPGNNNWVFGVTAIPPGDDNPPGFAGGESDHATYTHVDGTPEAGYRNNWVWMNNSLAQFGGGTGTGAAFDRQMDDAIIRNNVFRDLTNSCNYDGGASPNATAQTDCTFNDIGADQITGATITWVNNDPNHGTGAADLADNDVMPSAPGFGSWIKAYLEAKTPSPVGAFPWAGADMGANGGAATNCSPSYMRYYGACPGTGAP